MKPSTLSNTGGHIKSRALSSRGTAPPAPAILAGTTADRSRLLIVAMAAFVAASAVIVHYPVLAARAVSINDGMYVTHNPLVLQPSWRAAGRFLREVRKPSTVQGYYQPLTMISLMLDTVMGGSANNLRPYHRTSLLLHAANAALIVILLYLLLGEPWSAAFAGLLFGLHPMAVETMAWGGERKTLLATCFALLCIISYLRYTKRPRAATLVVSLAFFLLALMSKPTVTPLPAVLLLLDFWPLRRFTVRAVVEKVPFFLLAAIFAVITVISQQHTGIVAHRQISGLQHFLLICHNLMFYPLKMVWPSPLSSVYPFPEPIAISHPMVALGLAGTCLAFAAAIISLRWTRVLAVSWAVFLAVLAPTLMNIDYAMGVAADKYAYLPALGLLLALAWILGSVARRAAAWRWVTVLVVLGLASAETVLTRNYLNVWKDTSSLCRHILQVAPDTEWVHSGLTAEYLEKNQLPEALRHAERALAIEPQSHNAHAAMGQVLMRQGKPDQAIRHFEQALVSKPDLIEARMNLATCLASTNQIDTAITQMEQALAVNPALPEAQFNLGMMLVHRSRFEQARARFEEAIRLRPRYAEAHFRLADVLARQGDSPAAVEHYQKALQLRPNEPAVLTNLGIELARGGRLPEAIGHLRRVVKLVPNQPAMRNNLARALLQIGQVEEAATELQEVLRLAPDNIAAHISLAELAMKRSDADAAIREYRSVLAVDPNHAGARAGLDSVLATKSTGSRPQ